VTRCAVKLRPLTSALRAYCIQICDDSQPTGSQLSRARDSTRVTCIPEVELGDTIMAGIEENAMADDVDAQIQFYK
jgi:hypothetical protein